MYFHTIQQAFWEKDSIFEHDPPQGKVWGILLLVWYPYPRSFQARIQREGSGAGGPDPQPKKTHKTLVFLSNPGPDPLKNHKASKLAFNFGPSLARQWNAMYMAMKMTFHWRADDGPLVVVFWSCLPLSSKMT